MSTLEENAAAITVLPNVVRFGATSYQIANISFVRLGFVNKLRPWTIFLFLAGGMVLFAAYAAETLAQDMRSYVAISGAIAMVASLVIQQMWPKRECTFSMRMNSGDWESFATTERHAVKVKNAIEDAFVARHLTGGG